MDGIRTLIKTGYGAVGAVGGSGGGSHVAQRLGSHLLAPAAHISSSPS